ncbi:kinase-like protein [Coniochaeta sp. PMI_546]|nr:kinase-like protein [Coniochaeta sp. PMI_546]
MPMPRLVLECIPLGSLEDQHKENSISVEEAFEILCQGLSALRYLHGREDPIVHRDIKPSNILVQSRLPKLHIKLSAFGVSRVSLGYLSTYYGTPLYITPEVFAGKKYNARVDVWSLGMVVFEYAYGLPNPRSSGDDGAHLDRFPALASGNTLILDTATQFPAVEPESSLDGANAWRLSLR